MQVMNGVAYALCALTVWLAFAYRRPLSLPQWLLESGNVRSVNRELVRAAGVFVFLLVLDGVPDLYEQITGLDRPGFLGPGYLYVVCLLGGWVAGRWGGRFGIASALSYLLFRVFLPVVSIPVGMFFIDESGKTRIFVQRVVEQWLPLLLTTPAALAFTLTAALAGAWATYGKGSASTETGQDGATPNPAEST
jgi:hypothetical protein